MTAPLASWVGREERRVDVVDPTHLAAWSATLDRDDLLPRDGDPAPPGFHWALFRPLTPQRDLGPDGHARRGGFLPPVPLERRMWAGSRLVFHRPLLVGDPVELVSRVAKVEEKVGRSGPLCFVTVRHVIGNSRGEALEEEQDLVYRDAPKPGEPPPAPAAPAPRGAWSRRVVPDDVLLFRYSALTFNGHRIHYDRRFAAGEGYPGLVVHGPLIATLLLDLLRRELPAAELERFAFKGVRPTFDTGPFTLEGAPGDDPRHVRLWSTDNAGQLGVEAEARVR